MECSPKAQNLPTLVRTIGLSFDALLQWQGVPKDLIPMLLELTEISFAKGVQDPTLPIELPVSCNRITE